MKKLDIQRKLKPLPLSEREGILVLVGIAIIAAFLMNYIAWGLGGKWLFIFILSVIMASLIAASRNLKLLFIAIYIILLPLRIDIALRKEYFLILVSDFIVLGLYFSWLIEIVLRKELRFEFRREDFFALGFLVSCIISIIFNPPDPKYSYDKVFLSIRGFLIYFYFSRKIEREDELRFFLNFLLFTVFLESVVVLLQYSTGGPLGLKFLGERGYPLVAYLGPRKFFRAGGTLGHPNHLAFFLVLLAPVLLGAALSEIRLRRAFFIGVFLAGIPMILSLSKGSWIGFGVALLIIYFYFFKSAKVKSPGRFVLVLLFSLLPFLIFLPLVINRFANITPTTVQTRILLARISIELLKKHALIGIGLGNFMKFLAQYAITREFMLNPVHNEFLRIGSETGVLGLSFFLLFYASILRRAMGLANSSIPLVRAIAIGTIGSLVAFFIHSQVDVVFYTNVQVHLLFWSLCGMVSGLLNIERSESMKA